MFCFHQEGYLRYCNLSLIDTKAQRSYTEWKHSTILGLQPSIFNHDVARVAVNGANGGEDSGDEEAQHKGVKNIEHIPEVHL